MAGGPAPGRLRVVQDFINTGDLETGEEELAEPGDLTAWLLGHGLIESGASATRADLEQAQQLREALRGLAEANAGYDVESDALTAINEVATEAGFTLRFDARGVSLEPGSEGVAGALGRLLALVATGMGDGTWSRMKACRNETCRGIFYDHSRNRSGNWCSMRVCGNREKARVYRRRHSTASA
jgi:predicted RNA-binding Zn ribbon-like protein